MMPISKELYNRLKEYLSDLIFPKDVKQGEIGIIRECNYQPSLNKIIIRIGNNITELGNTDIQSNWSIVCEMKIEVLPKDTILTVTIE